MPDCEKTCLKNTKSEARESEQTQMIKAQNPKQMRFGHSTLEFWICFEFRY